MLNINISKDELTKELLPSEVEELYISLTNELINYAKLMNKRNLNSKKLSNIFFKLSTITHGSISTDFVKNLKIQEALTIKSDNVVNQKLDETLNNMLEILKEIKNGKSIYDINPNPIIKDENSSKNLESITSYVELRKNSYKIIEYIGLYIIQNKVPKDKFDKELFTIAIESLKAFNIDSIIKNRKNIKEITSLMNIINLFLTNKEIDISKLREIKPLLEDTKYIHIIEYLNETYIKTISPLKK